MDARRTWSVATDELIIQAQEENLACGDVARSLYLTNRVINVAGKH
jgi:hypothetical protein